MLLIQIFDGYDGLKLCKNLLRMKTQINLSRKNSKSHAYWAHYNTFIFRCLKDFNFK